jgi:hypothetical protein
VANTTRHAAVVVALFSCSPVMAAEGGSSAIVLHVDNYAHVRLETLADAEARAARIYAAAGVQIVWVDGDSDGSARDEAALHVRVLLLDREMSDSKIRSNHVADGVMGQAAAPTRRAYIFYFRISDLASSKGCLVNDLLGKVLAHEVGHLMLTAGHSDRGIMQSELDLRPNSRQQFTAAQATTLRTHVAPMAANQRSGN